MLRRLALTAALCLPACADVDDRSTDIHYLHAAIIEPNCTTIGCHSEATEAGNYDMSTAEAACEVLGGLPPANIKDYLRGESTNPDYPRMPPDVPLPEADIQLIERWLDAGAPCD